MNNFLKKFGKDFELYLGSFFLAVTSIIVTMNVFTRYFLKFTYHWAEEIAVGAFIWTIFLGFANAYKTKSLIGVEILTSILPQKCRNIVELVTSIIITILSVIMFYFSYKYVAGSTKITAALEISYGYINTSMIISFALITVYSINFSIQSFKKAFLNNNNKN